MKMFLETIVLHPYHREAPAHCLVHDSLAAPPWTRPSRYRPYKAICRANVHGS
jgi:hypothetical protein